MKRALIHGVDITSYRIEYLKDSVKIVMRIRNVGNKQIAHVELMFYEDGVFRHWGTNVFRNKLKISECINPNCSQDFEAVVPRESIRKTVNGDDFDFRIINEWNNPDGDPKWHIFVSYYVQRHDDPRFVGMYGTLFCQEMRKGHTDKINLCKYINGDYSIFKAHDNSIGNCQCEQQKR